MAVLNVQEMSPSGLDPSFAAAEAGGDTFANDGRTYLHVKNGSAGSLTVTVNAVKSCNFGFDHDAAVSVPAGGERRIGPFQVGRFGSTCEVSYSGVTSLTVAAVKVAA